MLVLSRKKNEGIVITIPPSTGPTKVVVTIVDVRGDKVRVGTAAPREVAVHRAEIQERVDEGREAAGPSQR